MSRIQKYISGSVVVTKHQPHHPAESAFTSDWVIKSYIRNIFEAQLEYFLSKARLKNCHRQPLQECIPVGCVQSAAVAAPGGGCLPARGVSACHPLWTEWKTSPYRNYVAGSNKTVQWPVRIECSSFRVINHTTSKTNKYKFCLQIFSLVHALFFSY